MSELHPYGAIKSKVVQAEIAYHTACGAFFRSNSHSATNRTIRNILWDENTPSYDFSQHPQVRSYKVALALGWTHATTSRSYDKCLLTLKDREENKLEITTSGVATYFKVRWDGHEKAMWSFQPFRSGKDRSAQFQEKLEAVGCFNLYLTRAEVAVLLKDLSVGPEHPTRKKLEVMLLPIL